MTEPATTPAEEPVVHRPVRAFVRHYVEMVVAMLLGMAVLYPPWAIATRDVDASWLGRPETGALVMATTMAVPMAVWMRLRGHAARANAEMALAMYGGFVPLFPFVWWGGLSGEDMEVLGHLLMLVLMLVAMLARRHEYAGHGHAARGSTGAEAQTQPWSRATR